MYLGILIHGVGRGGSVAESSFFREIHDNIQKKKCDVEIIYLYNHVGYLNNPRSKESFNIKTPSANAFNADTRVDFSSEKLLSHWLIRRVKQIHDVHGDNHKTYSNLICQLQLLNSFNRNVNIKKFDRVLVIRDDLVVGSQIVDLITSEVLDDRVLVSCWHWHNGVSERIFGGPARLVERLLSRIELVPEFIGKYGFLNGEYLMHFALKKYGIKLLSYPIKVSRVRSGNVVMKENFIVPFWRPVEFFRVTFLTLISVGLIAKSHFLRKVKA